MNHSVPNSHLIPSAHTHTHTHQNHKATCRTLTPPDPLQTAPHAAQTMRHRLKINGITSIELKCEECTNTQRIQKLNNYFPKL